ncbi:MAG: cytochrome c peroxidase [Bacteroidota bacterium]
MIYNRLVLILTCIIFTFLVGCEKVEDSLNYKYDAPSLPELPFRYRPNISANYPTLEDFSDEGATLGRVLFYDVRLSANNKMSCSSCHKQAHGFGDNVSKSVGLEGKLTRRNTPSLDYLFLAQAFFWDSREDTLEALVTKNNTHNRAMGLVYSDHLMGELSQASFYPALFEDAFGTEEITQERIGRALAMFLRSLETYRSKADQAGQVFPDTRIVFTPQEERGFQLFVDNVNVGCVGCHGGSAIRSTVGANIGLEMEYADPGMGRIDREKEGHFRIPSLRNIAVTAPYMHDGRFQTLEEVIAHYNNGIQPHHALSIKFHNGIILPPGPRPGIESEPKRLNLSEQDQAAIVAYLRTLTDERFLADIRYSDPFR